jgi:hypothetical protein
MEEVKVTERGWAGHFIGASQCGFRRNTLVEYGDKRIIVSTIGNYNTVGMKELCRQIGYERYYETMCFEAVYDGTYWDANVQNEVVFESKWAVEKLNHETDKEANEMHELVVEEIKNKIKNYNKK